MTEDQERVTDGFSATVSAPETDPLVHSGKVELADFCAIPNAHVFIYLPCREPWPAASVDEVLPAQQDLADDGTPLMRNGKPVMVKASKWLSKHRRAEQVSWWPGLPMFIRNRLVEAGGWKDHAGAVVLNLYKEPKIELGDPDLAGSWIEHVRRIYPHDADHIIAWCAHRVQLPGVKPNHGLILVGEQGIGKDTMLEPLKRTVGASNFSEVTPVQLVGRFNGFVRSVILRVSEARDTGAEGERLNRFALYDHLKIYAAAPPDVLRCDEKNLREHNVSNCLGLILTSNYRTDAIYLPPDDRRFLVAWSNAQRSDFDQSYWDELWAWYKVSGFRHVAAYLHDYDLTEFNAKAEPPRTEAFWAIVDNSRAPEEAELADGIDELGGKAGPPDAFTIVQLVTTVAELSWLAEPKNRRTIPYRMERCGYVPHRNPAARDGLWKINGRRQVVYVGAKLSRRAQAAAATALIARL